MFMGRRCARGQCRVWMPLPHFPGLSHTLNPIQYPPQLNFPPPPIMTPILIGVPPPPYSLPPPTGHSPVGTSSTGNSHCPTNAGQCGWCHYTHSPTCSESSGTSCSPGVDGRGATGPFATPHLWGLNWDPQLILTTCQLVDLPPPRHPQYGDVHPVHRSQPADSTSQI